MSETKRRAQYPLEFKMEEVCSVRQECNDPLNTCSVHSAREKKLNLNSFEHLKFLL